MSELRVKPHVIREVPGMGKVFDFRGTGLLHGTGVKIRPQIGVMHIPVYPNKPDYQDFLGLAGVLRDRGLNLQTATDRDGNVALFTRMDEMCWQAKGANQVSWGCEHMHMTVSESWTRRQLRAAAWLTYRSWRDYGIPPQMADLEPGRGVVRVKRRGITSHKNVADKAGFHDRIDPGPKFDWEYVFHCVKWYPRHHSSFVGA